MTSRVAPRLSSCIIVYFIALFLFGAISSLLAPDAERELGKFMMVGVTACVLPYVLFFHALSHPGDWLAYVVVLGIPTAIIAAGLKLSGWPRNLVVVALLFVAAVYALWAGRNLT